jgi:hypothetical protein
MDEATREKVGAPAFREAVEQKIDGIRQALEAQNVQATAPLVFYIGNVRVAATWNGTGPTKFVRVRIGESEDTQPLESTVPAQWVFGADPTQADVDYLLAGNRPA